MDQQTYENRGYLRESFRLFHLKDAMTNEVDWHYHSFHKIIIFLSGEASYGIEGKSYRLQPGDLVLVGSGCIHRPEVAPGAPYERMILYISPDYLRNRSTEDCDLEQCFQLARTEFDFVVRSEKAEERWMDSLRALEKAAAEPGFGQNLLQEAVFLQLMIEIGRGMLRNQMQYVRPSGCDEKIVSVLQYLSSHLTEEISIDDLAARFYISKYHMMRRFKERTGYTIHNYLVSKRLILAREQIAQGSTVSAACFACGFGDYSAFVRAYKKQFGISPRASK